MSIQVVRASSGRWNVTRVLTIWEDAKDGTAHEYEQVGRLMMENGRYYAERAIFVDDGVTYERIGPGRLLIKGALRDLVREREES